MPVEEAAISGALRADDMPGLPSYVLITPARNEARLIEATIKCMIAQTVLPLKWVIVSDGSVDGTDEIVQRYIESNPWIELVRMPERAERHFAGKVHAFNAGNERVRDLAPEFIGNLDADVTFEPDHFEFLVGKAAEDPSLGVFGAPFREGDFQYDFRYTNIENVWGGCQLFRRECYEDIGGYKPVKGGGIDHIAVVGARMNGWKTRTFIERVCIHHRVMGTAQRGPIESKFRMGVKDHSFGNHPLWELSRAVYQMRNRPFVIGGIAMAAGYFWSILKRAEIRVTPGMVRFVRREQMNRLRKLLGMTTGEGKLIDEAPESSPSSGLAKKGF
jgi:poly-beta-1,6-N-acetyl-D-glucosamine synthase